MTMFYNFCASDIYRHVNFYKNDYTYWIINVVLIFNIYIFSSYSLRLFYESICKIMSLIHTCKKSVSLKMCLAYFPLLNIPTTTAQDLIQNTTHVNCNLLHGAKLHSDTLLCIFENLKICSLHPVKIMQQFCFKN